MKKLLLKKSGFTLIEIMVVIAIIGILVSIVSVNFTEARQQSRDKVRMADLKQLQLALTLYKSQYGRYPAAGCSASMGLWVGPGPLSSWGVQCEEYISGLAPQFIPELPKDPNREYEHDLGFKYQTDINGTMYKVVIHNSVESLFIAAQSDKFSRLPGLCGISSANLFVAQYAVYSPGAECW